MLNRAIGAVFYCRDAPFWPAFSPETWRPDGYGRRGNGTFWLRRAGVARDGGRTGVAKAPEPGAGQTDDAIRRGGGCRQAFRAGPDRRTAARLPPALRGWRGDAGGARRRVWVSGPPVQRHSQGAAVAGSAAAFQASGGEDSARRDRAGARRRNDIRGRGDPARACGAALGRRRAPHERNRSRPDGGAWRWRRPRARGEADGHAGARGHRPRRAGARHRQRTFRQGRPGR